MSLQELCSISTATIKRNVSTQDASMGQLRNYTTAGRGTLPTTSTGRLVSDYGDRRFAYEMHDVEQPCKWYSVTDPQVDNRDILIVNGNVYFVQSSSNPDLLNQYYIVTLKFYGRQLQ